MKFHHFILSLLLATSSAPFVQADGDHAAPKGSSRAGESMAVTAFDPEEGFKMSEAGLTTMGVRFAKLEGGSPWAIPKSALVRIKHTTGLYRRFEGWISFVLVETTAKKDGTVAVKSEDLEFGDEVAVEGATFLRLTETDLNADTVDSCAH